MANTNASSQEQFLDRFLSRVVNEYRTVKEGAIVLIDIDNSTEKKELSGILEDLRDYLDEGDDVSGLHAEIYELVKIGSNIDNYLTASQEDLVQTEIDDTLIEDDGEPETRNRLDQDSVDNGGYKYDQLKALYEEDVSKLYDLMKDY